MPVWGTSVQERGFRGGGPWALYWRHSTPKNPGEWPQGPKSCQEWGAIWALLWGGGLQEGNCSFAHHAATVMQEEKAFHAVRRSSDLTDTDKDEVRMYSLKGNLCNFA